MSAIRPLWTARARSGEDARVDDALIMGIVNVTPDSFSDGGLFLESDAAIAHGRELVSEGAQILDIGGESTRPGAGPVTADEELRRVMPVIEGLAGGEALISIVTSGSPASSSSTSWSSSSGSSGSRPPGPKGSSSMRGGP